MTNNSNLDSYSIRNPPAKYSDLVRLMYAVILRVVTLDFCLYCIEKC